MTTKLVREQAVLLIVDVQERLMAAMDDEVAPRVVRNICILVEGARRMGIPIVVSEQYPKGLGPTVAPIQAALAEAGDTVYRLDKLEFSAAATPAFTAIRDKLRRATEPAKRADLIELASQALERLVHGDRHQWIVCGAEAHVCVYQTVRDLTNLPSAAVHVVADAVCSRTKQNWRIGLDLARQHGAIVTSTEICVFDLLGRAGTDEFKAMSKAVK